MAAQHDSIGCINGLYGKWLMITLQFSCLDYSIKHPRRSLYFIKKNIWGGLMEKYLREVIGN